MDKPGEEQHANNPDNQPTPSEVDARPAVEKISTQENAINPDTDGENKHAGFRKWLRDLLGKEADRHAELILAFAITAFAGCQLIVTCNNNRSTSQQVDRLIAATNSIQSAAQSFSGSAAGIASSASQFTASAGDIDKGISSAVLKLQAQAKATEDSVNTARNAVRENSSEAQRALTATIDTAHLDQRAWVVASNFSLSEEPVENKPFKVMISLANTGKTPALDVINVGAIYVWYGQPINNLAMPTNSRSRAMIPPTIFGASGSGSFETGEYKLSRRDLDQYDAKITNIYVNALISYKDVFGCPHWTRVCMFHVHGDPPEKFEFCSTGNEVDQNSCQNQK